MIKLPSILQKLSSIEFSHLYFLIPKHRMVWAFPRSL